MVEYTRISQYSSTMISCQILCRIYPRDYGLELQRIDIARIMHRCSNRQCVCTEVRVLYLASWIIQLVNAEQNLWYDDPPKCYLQRKTTPTVSNSIHISDDTKWGIAIHGWKKQSLDFLMWHIGRFQCLTPVPHFRSASHHNNHYGWKASIGFQCPFHGALRKVSCIFSELSKCGEARGNVW